MSLSLTQSTLAAWKLAYDQAIAANDAARTALALSRYFRTIANSTNGGAA
jgi:hypothetical protein